MIFSDKFIKIIIMNRNTLITDWEVIDTIDKSYLLYFKKIKRSLIVQSILVLVLSFYWPFNNLYGQDITVAEALQKSKNVSTINEIKNGSKNEKKILATIQSQESISEPQNLDTSYYKEPTPTSNNEESSGYMILWIKLILVMSVFCGGAYILLSYLKKKEIKQKKVAQHLFQNLGEFNLGLNKKIQIVKVLNDYYILACGQEEVTFLSKIEDRESLDILSLEGSKKQEQGFFEESLKSYLNVREWSPISITQNLKKKVKDM